MTQAWHSECDGIAHFSVTTPSLSSMTTTWNPEDCARYATICESAIYETDCCSSSVTTAVDFVSCVCKPKVTSLYSSCLYDGSIKCGNGTASVGDIVGFRLCPYFQSSMVRLDQYC